MTPAEQAIIDFAKKEGWSIPYAEEVAPILVKLVKDAG